VASKPDGASTFRIVCFGGSTGALHAYIDILNRLRTDTGMAFVIVAHHSIQHPHVLRDVLSSATGMAVADVEDGMRIAPDRVFVAPPRLDITLNRDWFRLAPPPPRRGWPTTISTFLVSLAQNAGQRAIAVILSGRDHDGSSALSAIRAAGGTNIAQADAPSPEMPTAAMATGCVDFFLPASGIADRLLQIAG
jgi:two-component system, chemotaxis family, CheB/CheR fusion protein